MLPCQESGQIDSSSVASTLLLVSDQPPGRKTKSDAMEALFIAAKRVGATGRAIGIDMTDEMIEQARSGVEKLGLKQVEIKKGTAEEIPVADSSVDVVITNGVLNLTANKIKAFAEIARILKPGARLNYSDIIMDGALSEGARRNIDLWTS